MFSASALDVIQAQYEAGSKRIVIAKKRLHPDFFLRSTGLAGEVLQKYVNYAGKIAHLRRLFPATPGNPCVISDWKVSRARDVIFVPTLPRKPLIG